VIKSNFTCILARGARPSAKHDARGRRDITSPTTIQDTNLASSTPARYTVAWKPACSHLKHSPKVRWRAEGLHMRLALFCMHPGYATIISYPSSHQPCLDLPLATHLASATDQDSRWTPPSPQLPCRLPPFHPPHHQGAASLLFLPSPCRPQTRLRSDNSKLGPSTHWHRLRLDGQFQSPSMHAHVHVRTHPCKICLIYIPLHVTLVALPDGGWMVDGRCRFLG
jgi:hypothetical protein